MQWWVFSLEVLIFIGVCWVIYSFFGNKDSSSSNQSGNSRNSQSSSHSNPPPSKKPRENSQVYRPKAQSSTSVSRKKINFADSSSSFSTTQQSTSGGSSNRLDPLALSGLHDAFTGAPLNENLGLHQCQNCNVFYHAESITVLREANAGQCVACQSTKILVVNIGKGKKAGRDYTPDVITLSNYMDHIGSVVTFEARVVEVRESRRGNDFAVMFERKSWSNGFKLVFFRDAVRKVGGKPYITSLSEKAVRVRGLVVKHPKFGYQIIVSEKSMILSVR